MISYKLRNLTFNDTSFDSATIHDVELGFDDNFKLHTFGYAYASGRFSPDPSKYDYDIYRLMCNKDKCNRQSNEDTIKHTIKTNSNDFIGSTTTKSKSVSFNIYFFCLVLIDTFFL